MLDEKLLNILVCPADRGPLLLVDEVLYNPRLRQAYRIDDGIPVLLVDEAVDVGRRRARAPDGAGRVLIRGRSPVR